jgi:hypothetical protein
LIAAAAVAGEEHRTHIKIAVDGGAEDHRSFEWTSDDSDFDLHNLEVGESRTLTDDDGKEVVVTREENGLVFDVDGEKIELMHLNGTVDVEVLHDDHNGENVFIKEHNTEVHMIKADSSDGVTIISGDEIDDETRAKIEEALKEAGKDGNVLFIDGSELSGDEQAQSKREVRIIKKKVDVTD